MNDTSKELSLRARLFLFKLSFICIRSLVTIIVLVSIVLSDHTKFIWEFVGIEELKSIMFAFLVSVAQQIWGARVPCQQKPFR